VVVGLKAGGQPPAGMFMAVFDATTFSANGR
jgi:hypothetical protein